VILQQVILQQVILQQVIFQQVILQQVILQQVILQQVARTLTGDEVNTEGRAVYDACLFKNSKFAGKKISSSPFCVAKKKC